MALFTNQKQGGPGGAGGHPGKLDVDAQVRSMRSSGLTDDQILSELKSQGAKETQVINSLGKISSEMPMSGADMMGGPNDIDLGMGAPPGAARGMPNMGAPAAGGADSGFRLPTPPAGAMGPGMSGAGRSKGQSGSEDLYERIEEIAEEMIDEKWDDLIKEVQKIIAWKNKSGTRLIKLESDVGKLKEDFKMLHQGVLGKVEEYDKRMTDVGVELKAVGKVFKDVIPVFTENVKELRDVTKGLKK